MLDYGSGRLADGLEKIIGIAETTMGSVMNELYILCAVFFALNIMYEIFLLSNQMDLGEIIKKIITEVIYGAAILILIKMWMPLLDTLLMPLLFQKIPGFIFNFGVGGHKILTSNDKVLLNLDATWKILEQIPKRVGQDKSGLQVLIEWVMISNIGIYLSYLALKFITWFIVIFMFADIIREILSIHIMFAFSGIIFPLMTFKPFRDNYGYNVINVLLICTIQYYMLFLLVWIITGYMDYLFHNYGMFIYIVGIILLKGMFNGVLKVIHEAGTKL